jgi:photosystem II stability/assembly factor-like uncharacterized protein
LFVSRDGGVRWTAASCSWVGVHASVDPGSGTIYVGTSVREGTNSGGAILRSSDGGRTWKRLRDLGGDSAISVAVRRDVVTVGTEGGGVLRSDDAGKHWRLVPMLNDRNDLNAGTDGPQVNDLAFGVGARPLVWAATRGEGVLRSDDLGQAWGKTGLRNARVDQVVGDPRDARTAYAVTDAGYVERTVDAGRHWSRLRAFPIGVWTLVMSGDAHQLYVVSETGAIFRTRDRAQHWTRIPAPGP